MATLIEQYIESHSIPTVEKIREDYQVIKQAKELTDFKECIKTEAFQNLMQKIQDASKAGAAYIQFFPMKKEEYTEILNNHHLITQEQQDFNSDYTQAFAAFRTLGFKVDIEPEALIDEQGNFFHPKKCTIRWA